MPLAENLKAAKDAVDYVKKWNLQTSNKVGDRIAAAGGIENVGAGQGPRKFKLRPDGTRVYEGTLVYDLKSADPVCRDLGPAGQAVGAMRARAAHLPLGEKVALYKIRRFGNCFEQAEIALWFLLGEGIRPLDLMTFSYLTKPQGYDHVWVVVGLDPGWQRADLRSWGANAVWCDPWQGDGVAFAITEFIKGGVRNLNNQYKCHTVELVQDGWPCSTARWN